MDSLCFGSTYVPANVAIQMQQEKHMRKVIIDMNDTRSEETFYMQPQFPSYIYPIQKSHEYGATPILTPTLNHKEKNTSMLWCLVNMLTLIEEIWSIVSKVELRQSYWHGWLLTYITKASLTHHNTRAFKKDPYRINMKEDINCFMDKIVSFSIIIFFI